MLKGELMAAQRDLFSDARPDVDIAGMVHRGDPFTSVDAATVIGKKLTELHERVLAAFDEYGRMTDETLEQLPEFRDFGPSTIRKRRSELFQAKRLAHVAEDLNSRGRKMIVWDRVR